MDAETFIGKLDNVRPCGPGRWAALCPAHKGDGRSLSIREADSGVILLRCWAHGCDVADICAAVNLTVSDLFPEKRAPSEKQDGRDQFAKPKYAARRAHWHAAPEALKSLHGEAVLVLVAAEHLARGEALDDDDIGRVTLAAHRIGVVAERIGALATADEVQERIRKQIEGTAP